MKFINRILHEEFPFLFAVPALFWQIFFLYVPLTVIVFFSFVNYSEFYGLLGFTFSHYLRVFKLIYVKVIFNSLSLAFFTSIICFLVGYPLAYFLAFKVKRFKTLFLFLLILPSWSNLIVEVYAWYFLLEKRGLISKLLYYARIISTPTHMINNYFAVLLGMVYCFLPFMVLPIYIVLERMDRSLFEASADLGANAFNTFKRVVFPISLPGVSAGFLLVFVPAFGEFVIPLILGGGKEAFWGTVIVDKFLLLREWGAGFAFASMGILFLILFFLFVYVLLQIGKYLFALKRIER